MYSNEEIEQIKDEILRLKKEVTKHYVLKLLNDTKVKAGDIVGNDTEKYRILPLEEICTHNGLECSWVSLYVYKFNKNGDLSKRVYPLYHSDLANIKSGEWKVWNESEAA